MAEAAEIYKITHASSERDRRAGTSGHDNAVMYIYHLLERTGYYHLSKIPFYFPDRQGKVLKT
jgi:hypothetical protein